MDWFGIFLGTDKMKITCTIQSTYDSGERIDIVLVDAELGYKESRMVYEETLFNFIPMFNFENRIKKSKITNEGKIRCY